MIPDPTDLGLLIGRVQHGHHRALDEALAPLGVTLVQWNGLRALDRHPGASQHALAEATFNSDQAMGALLQRLLARGLVARAPGPGRALRHRLTPAGQAILEQGRRLHADVLAQSMAALDAEERAALGRLLGKVLAPGGEEAVSVAQTGSSKA